MANAVFVIRLPIRVGDQERRTLAKSFRFAGELRNAVTGKGWARVQAMRNSPEWKAAQALPKGKAPIKRFLSIHGIYSACGFRITHGLAPQSAETEPVNCFNTAIAGHRRYPLRLLYHKISRVQYL